MEDHIWSVFSVSSAIILALIGLVYKNLIVRMEDIRLQMIKLTTEIRTDMHNLMGISEKGLELKVDKAEYRVVREWEKELFSGIQVSIKDLKDENNLSHQAIMVEIRGKKNDKGL